MTDSECLVSNVRSVALRMISVRDRTCMQVTRALQSRGYDEKIVALTVERLQQEGYLDDKKFAYNFIDIKLGTKEYGPFYLRAALERAGVEKQLASDMVLELVGKDKEEELAAAYLKRLAGKERFTPEKLIRRMLSRGFSFSVAKKLVEKELAVYLDITT